jgi:hypothetical protein
MESIAVLGIVASDLLVYWAVRMPTKREKVIALGERG